MDAAETPRWTIQVDPLTTALGFVHVQTERALSPSFSVYLGPHLRLFDGLGGTGQPYRGVGIEVGARWFPWKAAPEDAWLLVRGVQRLQYAVGDYGIVGFAPAAHTAIGVAF